MVSWVRWLSSTLELLTPLTLISPTIVLGDLPHPMFWTFTQPDQIFLPLCFFCSLHLTFQARCGNLWFGIFLTFSNVSIYSMYCQYLYRSNICFQEHNLIRGGGFYVNLSPWKHISKKERETEHSGCSIRALKNSFVIPSQHKLLPSERCEIWTPPHPTYFIDIIPR